MKLYQNHFGQGMAGGVYDAPPDLLIGWGRGHLSLFPSRFDTFGDRVATFVGSYGAQHWEKSSPIFVFYM